MKKILLFIGMFLITLNVKALTFNVDLTNIEDKGNNGTIGQITNIDIPNKTIDAYFQDIGDEVSFDLTITNSGNRAGTLKSIGVTSTNNKISYTHNLPSNGLSINGNDFNTVTITAKVKEGATNGTSTSTIKITYNYDEGSCPEGEILSEDESMCLCPTGKVRNEQGVCIDPPKDVTCEDDEIYNETKKICEKKVVPTPDPEPNEPTPDSEPTPEPEKEVIPTPVNPSNPKTMDNIILITLLFFVSGLGIYAVLFKKLDTNKKKATAGVITGVITLSLSFTVLAGVFGIDDLLGAIVNPITKKQELVVTVNETIDMIETWDGRCELQAYDDLIPENIFEGGSGTEEDPYLIKTAEQLGCFAKSVNNGEAYEGQFVKQIRNIKLNDNLIESADADDWTGIQYWTSIGNSYNYYPFSGTYDGDNHTVSGMYIHNFSSSNAAKGFFGYTENATIKNLTVSDIYVSISDGNFGGIVGKARGGLTIKNVKTYGKVGFDEYSDLALPGGSYYWDTDGGIVGYHNLYGQGKLIIEDVENNISPITSGIIGNISDIGRSDEPNIILRNVVNNGDFYGAGGIAAYIQDYGYNGGNVLIENAVNNGNYNYAVYGKIAGVVGSFKVQKLVIKNSGNTGDITGDEGADGSGGISGSIQADDLLIDGCYNSGDLRIAYNDSYASGVTVTELNSLRSANPYSEVGGIVGRIYVPTNTGVIKNSYNTGMIGGLAVTGGIVAYNRSEIDTISSNLLIENCYNSGSIFAGDGATGGLVGNTKGTIKDSYNTGTITVWGFRDPYSIIGNTSIHYGTLVGGLVGKGNNYTLTEDVTGANIINSYNEGDIIITAKTNEVSIGGICGACSTITDGRNSGNIISKYATQTFDGIGFRIFNSTSNTTFDGTITTENLTY